MNWIKTLTTVLLFSLSISLAGQKYYLTKVATTTWNTELGEWNNFKDELDYYGTILFTTDDDNAAMLVIRDRYDEKFKYFDIYYYDSTPNGRDCIHYYSGTDASGKNHFFMMHHFIGKNVDSIVIFLGGGNAIRFTIGEEVDDLEVYKL